MRKSIAALKSAVVLSCLAGPAAGQCEPQWQEGFDFPGAIADGSPVLQVGRVNSMITADTGSGPELFVHGTFWNIGGLQAWGIGRWDGRRWHWSSSGFSASFSTSRLTRVSNGDVDTVYANSGGRVHRWTGTRWAAIPGFSPQVVRGLSMGGVERLYGFDGDALSVLDDQGWIVVSQDLPVQDENDRFTVDRMSDLVVFDDGSGEKIYVVGKFTRISDGAVSPLIVLNGEWWSLAGAVADVRDVTGGSSSPVGSARAIVSHLLGSQRIILTGDLLIHPGDAGRTHVATFDGADFATVGSPGEIINSQSSPIPPGLAIADFGEGPRLMIGGVHFRTAHDPADVFTSLLEWDGAAWRRVGEEFMIDSSPCPIIGGVWSLHTTDLGQGMELFVGGKYSRLDHRVVAGESCPELDGGLNAMGIARFNGERWRSLGNGVGAFPTGTGENFVFNRVSTLISHDDGSGERMYAGGAAAIGGVYANNIASWDGDEWHPVGEGLPAAPTALLSYGRAANRALIAGVPASVEGANPLVAWDGHVWRVFVGGVSGIPQPRAEVVQTLAQHDVDGAGPAEPLLIVGGTIDHAGSTPVSNIAAWDGIGWNALAGGVNGPVMSLLSFDDGQGAVLAVGGAFSMAGGVSASNVAVYRGGVWSALGEGLPGEAIALGWFEGQVFAAYRDGLPGSSALTSVARWDGVQWTDASDGILNTQLSGPAEAQALLVFDDGGGPVLYAGAVHYSASFSGLAGSLYRWSGIQWEMVQPFLDLTNVQFPDNGPRVLAHFNDGTGPSLFCAGRFAVTDVGASDGPNDTPSWGIAQLKRPGLASITAQPSDVSVDAGGVVELVALVEGFDSLQWTKDGAALVDDERIMGATTNVLTITGAIPGDTGYYALRAITSCGANTSREAAVFVKAPFCTGDANGDGRITQGDIASVLANFGSIVPPHWPAGSRLTGDADNDGDVDFGDVGAVLAAFGTTCN